MRHRLVTKNLAGMSPCELPERDDGPDEPDWTPPQFSLAGLFFLTLVISVVLAVAVAPGWTSIVIAAIGMGCWMAVDAMGVERIFGVPIQKLTWVEWLVVIVVFGMLMALKLPPVEMKSSHRRPAAPVVAPGVSPPMAPTDRALNEQQ